jgi:hypothetical protein
MGIEPSGEVVLAGTWDQYSPPSHAYAFITKIDTDGHDEWYKQFSGSDDVLASDVGLDPAGNIILVGSFEGTVNFGGSTLINEQSRSLYLSKFDPKGQHIWSHGYGEHEYGSAWSVATDADGNVVLAGDFRGDIDFGGGPLKSKGDYDIFIVKFDPDALFRWNRSFGDHETQCVSDISITDAGSILVTGCFWGEVDFGGRRLRSLGESDIYVAALDKDGGHLWSDGFGDPADDQSGVSIAIDDQGKVIVGGDFRGTVDFGSGPLQSEDEIDIFLVKFGSNIAARGNPGPILTGGADGTPARTLQLCQNFPNPFNPTTTIPVEIPERTNATLVIYDVAGRVVRTLLDGVAGAGRKEIIWDGRDFGGNSVSSGVYFCRFAAGRVVQTKKLILLK